MNEFRSCNPTKSDGDVKDVSLLNTSLFSKRNWISNVKCLEHLSSWIKVILMEKKHLTRSAKDCRFSWRARTFPFVKPRAQFIVFCVSCHEKMMYFYHIPDHAFDFVYYIQ